MINPETKTVKPSSKVDGFIPGISNLGPEAQANLARALAEEPGAYNSSETLAKVFAPKVTNENRQ